MKFSRKLKSNMEPLSAGWHCFCVLSLSFIVFHSCLWDHVNTGGKRCLQFSLGSLGLLCHEAVSDIQQETHTQCERLCCSQINLCKALTYHQLVILAANAGINHEWDALLHVWYATVPLHLQSWWWWIQDCVLWATLPFLWKHVICSLTCSKMLFITFHGKDP